MQISVFYDHITQAVQQTGKHPADLLNICKGYGIDGLEINYTQLKKGGFLLRHRIRRAGLAVSCIYEFHDFTHNTDLTLAKKQVELAVKVGAEKVLIVPGFLEEQEAEELNACSQDAAATARYMESHISICRVRDALRELVQYGQKRGVKITLEDFDGFTSPCARMNALKWLLEQVTGLGYTLDMGNFAYSDEDVKTAYELLKPYIVHVHCKDRGVEEQYQPAEPGEDGASVSAKESSAVSRRYSYCRGLGCVPVGSGYLPIRELVVQLREQGYKGYLAIEHFDAPDQLTYMRQSANFLREINK